MGYKGRREAPRAEKASAEMPVRQDPPEDPFASSPAQGDPFAEPPSSGRPAQGPKESGRSLGDRWGDYWDSGKGKILLSVVGCLAVFALAIGLALRAWIKPPPLPGDSQREPSKTAVNSHGDASSGEDAAGPTDDELYPDDGFGGDMPTVSGNRKDGVYTFLLVGTDMDDGNTDTIMVAAYDTKEQDVNIMSIPRDTMVNERWDIKKINSIYSRTGNSIEALAGRVQKLIGFQPDFYVKVELGMFVELVDLVEGVEFDVPQDMNYDDPYQDLHIHLKKGVQTLNGEQAMQLVRFRRYSEGDIKRVEVQQAFMKALIKECISLQHWGKMKAYIDLAMKNVETDLQSGEVVWFAANVLGLNGVPALNMSDVYTCTLPGDYWGSAWSRDTHQEQSYVTIYPREVVKLVNERFNPYEQQVTTAMLDAMSILSNGDIASSTGSLRDTQHNAIMAVRRGEAYYDDEGKLVYGPPPVKPEQDEEGNYFILDEDGNTVYTDESGTPLEEPSPPPDESSPGSGTIAPSGPGDPITLPTNPVDNTTGEPGDLPAAGDPGEGDGSAGQQPDTEPAPPPEDPSQTGAPGQADSPDNQPEQTPDTESPTPPPQEPEQPVPDLIPPGWL